MNVEVSAQPRAAARASLPQAIIDCDIHPALRSQKDLHPYLSAVWRKHLDTYGLRYCGPFTGATAYPRATPALSRRDAWPPDGGPPGSSLSFMREQFLDACNVEYGMLHLLSVVGMQERNLDFSNAVCRAINDWQFHEWTQKEKRLKASIMLPGEDAAASVKEIERWAGVSDFAQISLACRTIEPLGRRRYWPIYEAAVKHKLPIALHLSGENGHPVAGGGGWGSYYQEVHHSGSFPHRSLATSLIFEGVFDRFPELKVVLVEGGFAWVPSWQWRMDRHWERMRDEIPHVKRPPSEYVRQNLWFTTQPIDEPEKPDDLHDVIEWIGWDRVLLATDYPHWDFDDPTYAFKFKMTTSERRALFSENARNLYGLG